MEEYMVMHRYIYSSTRYGKAISLLYSLNFICFKLHMLFANKIRKLSCIKIRLLSKKIVISILQ